MIDYDLTTGDVTVSDGDIAMIDDPRATRQRLEQKLKLWRGEWFLNSEAGFPWLPEILGRRPRPEVVRSLIFDLVTTDPGIRAIKLLEIEFDPIADRQLRVSFDATLSTGVTESMDIVI